jgi:copper resistance protein B
MSRTGKLACIALVATGSATFPTLWAWADEPPHHHEPQHAIADHAATETADSPGESERHHVPPDPPAHSMHDMSEREMVELMEMDDTAPVGLILLDQLEWRDDDVLSLNADAWYGGDYDKAWLKLEGEREAGESSGRIELLWDHVVARWWNLQAGARHDFGPGPARTWFAIGIRGIAPHWIHVEATAYVGESGDTAARFSAEQDLLVTQRLVLQPKLELNLYGQGDPQNDIGAGLADTELALRLRYEVRREFAPYIGIVWKKSHGDTADLVRAQGRDTDDIELAAGLRVWF